MREAVWLRDAKTREILYVNPAFENLFGFSCQYFSQNPESMLDVVHPDDKERIAKAIKNQYQQIPFNEEYRVICPDGDTRWISGQSVLLFNNNREIDGFVALSQDITERKNAEIALRESEEKFKTLADQSPNIIFINKKGVIVYCNAKSEEIMGYSQKELLSPDFNFMKLVAPEYRESMKENFSIHSEGKEVPPLRYAIQTKSGDKIDSIISTKLIDYEGTKAILGVITDISEHVQTLNELKDSETKFRAIFEYSRDAILLEKAGILVLCNQSFLNLFGYKSFDECIGKPSAFLVSFEERSRIDTYTILRTKGGEAPLLYETRGVKKDGTPFDMEVRVSPFMSLDEIYTLVTLVDVSERKRAEKEIRDSLLEKEVLLREVHHRVKNNMQIISSLLRLQAGQVEDQNVLKIFQSCQNRIRSMSLVHEKLYTSKNLSGIFFSDYVNSLTAHLVLLNKIDPGMVKLKQNMGEIYIDLQIAIPLGLILNELITNSLKYAFPDGREGEIEISMRALDKDSYRLIVQDNGIGIPKDFDFDNPKSFGLQIVKMLVDQLDGRVLITNDTGTKFEITFKDTLYRPRIY